VKEPDIGTFSLKELIASDLTEGELLEGEAMPNGRGVLMCDIAFVDDPVSGQDSVRDGAQLIVWEDCLAQRRFTGYAKDLGEVDGRRVLLVKHDAGEAKIALSLATEETFVQKTMHNDPWHVATHHMLEGRFMRRRGW
jgi:hypothetical protein